MPNEKDRELQFEIERPKKEIDEPLIFSNGDIGSDSLDTKRMDIEEKDKERKEKRYFSAFKLIVGCLIFLGCIYLIEVIDAAILKQDLTSITSEIVEVVKTLLFTLSGYLFARKENGD